MKKKHFFIVGAIILLFAFFLFIGNVYIHRLGAFGCFDDCFNIVGAYFLGEGKILYKDIFFNHMPLGAYVSWLIQSIGNPQTFYQLILYHRIFILAFAFLWNVYFIIRFGWWWIGFGVLFEGTKFYVFGDRFLAESMVAYPLVFMFVLMTKKIQNKLLTLYDCILISVSIWFVAFMRETFIPIAFLFFLYFIWKEKDKKYRILYFSILLFLTAGMFIVFPFSDFFFNVVTVNKQIEINTGYFAPMTILQMFFYPLFIFLGNIWNHFRYILILLSVLFCFLFVVNARTNKQWRLLIAIAIMLGMANLRVVPVGKVFFDAFHMFPWYGMFIASTIILIEQLNTFKLQKLHNISIFLYIIILVFSISSPKSFLYEHVDTIDEFTAGYARYFVNGEVIRLLARPSDTFYVEMWDDPLYWQAKLPSPYQYSWYTSIMPFFTGYLEAREYMWRNNPPDFYYGNCRPNESHSALMPDDMRDKYIQLYFSDVLSCIYVKKTKIDDIPKEKWDEIMKFGYSH